MKRMCYVKIFLIFCSDVIISWIILSMNYQFQIFQILILYTMNVIKGIFTKTFNKKSAWIQNYAKNDER